MTRRINHTDTNKLIRETLKAEFPNVKFSVKKTGGSSTSISYTGEVTVAEVESVISMFEGASFDGMYDLETPRYVETEGERVSYGAKYIFVNRTWDDEEIVKFAQYFVDNYAWYDFHNNQLDTVPTYEVKNGRVICDREHFVSKRDLNEMVWRTAKDFRTFADFMKQVDREKAERDAWWEEKQRQDAIKKAQEQVWDNALDEAIEANDSKTEPQEINEYEEMLKAAGWID